MRVSPSGYFFLTILSIFFPVMAYYAGISKHNSPFINEFTMEKLLLSVKQNLICNRGCISRSLQTKTSSKRSDYAPRGAKRVLNVELRQNMIFFERVLAKFKSLHLGYDGYSPVVGMANHGFVVGQCRFS